MRSAVSQVPWPACVPRAENAAHSRHQHPRLRPRTRVAAYLMALSQHLLTSTQTPIPLLPVTSDVCPPRATVCRSTAANRRTCNNTMATPNDAKRWSTVPRPPLYPCRAALLTLHRAGCPPRATVCRSTAANRRTCNNTMATPNDAKRWSTVPRAPLYPCPSALPTLHENPRAQVHTVLLPGILLLASTFVKINCPCVKIYAPSQHRGFFQQNELCAK
jgi:hypothetical protein